MMKDRTSPRRAKQGYIRCGHKHTKAAHEAHGRLAAKALGKALDKGGQQALDKGGQQDRGRRRWKTAKVEKGTLPGVALVGAPLQCLLPQALAADGAVGLTWLAETCSDMLGHLGGAHLHEKFEVLMLNSKPQQPLGSSAAALSCRD